MVPGVEPKAPTENKPVAITSVIRGLGAGGAVRIAVHGTWRVDVPDTPPVLIVDDGRERHVVPALPVSASADDPGALQAEFDLPPGLGGVTGEGLVLSVAGTQIALPDPLPSVPPASARDVAAEAPPEPAEVIDRSVLAEHRARRAEQGLEDFTERLRALEAHLAEVTEERDRLREEIHELRAQLAARPEPAVGLAELGETARELRRHAEDQLAARAPAEPPGERDPFDVALAELRARTAPPPSSDPDEERFGPDPLRNTMNLAAMSPGRRARSRLRRVAPSDRKALDPDAIGPDRRPGVPWLSGAIELFAAEDIPSAGAFLVALLPHAASTLDGDLSYDVELERVGAFRVAIAGGRGEVTPASQAAPDRPAFTVAGPVALLAPLGAGGAPRRLGGARVNGSRRALRRLLKARRAPVDLGDLSAAGIVPDPALLLRTLAASVRPSWIADEFAVAVDVPGHEPITVIAEPGRRLQVVGAPPSGGAVRAVLTSSPAALLALLGRVAPPAGDDAMLAGEEPFMTTLLELLDRAQGLPSRH
jgi:hypothetical protein